MGGSIKSFISSFDMAVIVDMKQYIAGASPAVRGCCRNSSTEPTREWMRSKWLCLHHNTMNCQFSPFNFFVEGALTFRMVSTTVVEITEFSGPRTALSVGRVDIGLTQ